MALANQPRVSRSLSYSTPDGSGVLKGGGQFTLGGDTLHWRRMSEGGGGGGGEGHFTLLHGYNYNNYCRKNGIRITKK